MPEVKYTFTAQDRTTQVVARIKRQIQALGRVVTTARINVRANGLGVVRNSLRDMAKSYSATIDLTLSEAALNTLKDIPERRTVAIDVSMSEGALNSLNDIPERRTVAIDTIMSDGALNSLNDIPERRTVAIDTIMSDGALSALNDIPENKTITIDTTMGNVVAELPNRHEVAIDTIPGSLSVQLPNRHEVRIDQIEGATLTLPSRHSVMIDTVPGSLGVQLPDRHEVYIDQVEGAVISLPNRHEVAIDTIPGSLGVQLPSRHEVRIDQIEGSVVSFPDRHTVYIDTVPGSLGVQLPERHEVRIDQIEGSIISLPSRHEISVDTILGDLGVQMPERHEVLVDANIAAAEAAITNLPSRHTVAIDTVLGELGVQLPARHTVYIDQAEGTVVPMPDRHEVRIDTVPGNLGVALPEMHEVRVDANVAAAEAAITNLPSTHTVTVNSVTGTQAAPGVGPGGGGDALLTALGGLQAGIAGLVGMLGAAQLVDRFQSMVADWQDIDAAVAAVSSLASNITGEELTLQEERQARETAGEISQGSDLSTKEALGVIYMGLQQGRTLEEMTTGGIAQQMVKIAQATKGFGQSTFEALPSVVSAITDIIDRNPDMTLEGALQHAEKLAITYVGSGKGDITNFARAMGLISGQAGMQGWTQNEALAFLSAGLGGFARPSEAATGQRNMIRDLVTSSGKKEAYGAYRELGLVREGSEVYDDKGNVVEFASTLFDETSGLLLTPDKLIPMLQEAFASVDSSRVPRLLPQLIGTTEAQQFFDFLMKSSSEEKYGETLAQYETADAEAAAARQMESQRGQAQALEGRRTDSGAMIAEMMGLPGFVGSLQSLEHGVHDKVLSDYEKWLENQEEFQEHLAGLQTRFIRQEAPHLSEEHIQLAAYLEDAGARSEDLQFLYNEDMYNQWKAEQEEQQAREQREQRRVELEERAGELRTAREQGQYSGPGGADSIIEEEPIVQRTDVLNLEGRERVITNRTTPVSTQIEALNLDAGLSGAPPIPMLPEEQAALQTIEPPTGVADVKARVTELDTSAVEGKLIKIAADVVLNAVTTPEGTRITQDTTTGQNEIYNSRRLNAQRQAAILEDAR